jgi:hypothetical protein
MKAMNSDSDRVYERALKVFERQVHEATQIWYASRTMDEVSLRKKKTLEALNATPLFWITVRSGLAQYALIALGRVFDQRSPRNMDTILRLTYESRQRVFSKDALALRKRIASDNADEWLAAFMERASAPAIADFKRLSRLVKKYRKIYDTQYHVIRNKTLAHTEIVDGAELAALYAKTNIRNLERLPIFLNTFHKALWELFYNGRRPRLRPMRFSSRSLTRTKLAGLRRHAVHEDIVSQTREALALFTDAVSQRGACRAMRKP